MPNPMCITLQTYWYFHLPERVQKQEQQKTIQVPFTSILSKEEKNKTSTMNFYWKWPQ